MSSRMNVLQQNQEKKVKLFVHAVEREKQKKKTRLEVGKRIYF